MTSRSRFNASEDDYESFSSEDEKKLQVYRSRKKEDSDSEVEVYGVGSDNDSDSDNQSDIALSDVEGQEQDDNLPDVRAWGKEKKKYYGADYVDPDYGGFQGKDAQAAEIEETEAKNLQSQLIQQLDDNDFSLDVIFKKPEKEEVKEKSEELIKTDLSKLTSKQKIHILQKDSPEFFALIKDCEAKMNFASYYLLPLLQKVRNGEIEQCQAVKFVETHYSLILNYCTNVNMYLLLKANNKLKNHPVIQRLYQYRQLLSQAEKIFDEVMKPQVELLVFQHITDWMPYNDFSKVITPTMKKKKLKLLAKLQKPKKTKPKSDSDQPTKKIKLDDDKNMKKVTFEGDTSGEDLDLEDAANNDEPEEVAENGLETEEMSKRAITYKMSKNKGLTPHRKKELRNPRVKHKLKFRKALIRRKGAVREPRKELSRYGGEISGIKSTVSKSIKIK